MFITNHVLAGTIAGTLCRRRPLTAFAIGMVTHVAMDAVPHWGDATLSDEGFYRVARRDGLLGLATLALVAAAGVPPRTALLAGVAGAAALDADKPCRFLLGVDPFPDWLNRFHGWIQWRETPAGLRVELVAGAVLAGATAAVLAAQRRAA